jgi:predicted DNA-binding protein (MmcQ/YjbR family)
MVTRNVFRQLALSFPEVTEQPHFEKLSYRVNKKIFVTHDEANDRITIKLSEADQSVFCSYNLEIIYPVKGTWGKQGWTIIELKKIRKEMLTDALTVAYCQVAPKRLTEAIRNRESEI